MSRALEWLFGLFATAVVAFALRLLPGPAAMLATVMLIPLPLLSIMQARALAQMDLATLPRMQLYVSSVVTLWVLAILALSASQKSGFPAAIIGFDRIGTAAFVAWTIFVLACALLLVALSQYFDLPESPVLWHVVPVTWAERFAFVIVSLTAGITEEIAFRGFLIAALTVVMPNAWVAAIAAALAFGMLHAYQGRVGIARTTLLGFALAVPFIMTSSIMPSIVAHILIDLVGGFWLVKQLRVETHGSFSRSAEPQ